MPRREEDVGLIEQAVSQACADEDAYEAIDEERVEESFLHLLLAVEPLHDEIGECEADEPAQRIPVDGEPPEREGGVGGVPEYG